MLGFGTTADGSDAFLVHRIVFSAEPTPQSISAAPPNPVLATPWTLRFEAISRSDGSVELDLEVPGGGKLGASAISALKVRAGRHERVVHRDVAATARTIDLSAANPVHFRLSLRPAYRRLAGRPGGLIGTLTVTFSAPGHPVLHGTIRVRFAARSHAGARRRGG